MSARLSVTFASLFFTSISGIVVCVVLFLSDTPWNFDRVVNEKFLGLKNTSIDHWLFNLEKNGINLKGFLTSLYIYCIGSTFVNAAFILTTILSASTNQPLILSFQLIICVFCSMLIYLNSETQKESIHSRLLKTVFSFNVIGLFLNFFYFCSTRESIKNVEEDGKKDE
eukprot:Sdes_comp20185_c0_seq1m13449